jgi:hypothetical protein
MCIYVCMYACMYTHIRTYLSFNSEHLLSLSPSKSHMSSCACMYVYAHRHTCMHTCIFSFWKRCLSLSSWSDIHTYIQKYIHTYMHYTKYTHTYIRELKCIEGLGIFDIHTSMHRQNKHTHTHIHIYTHTYIRALK